MIKYWIQRRGIREVQWVWDHGRGVWVRDTLWGGRKVPPLNQKSQNPPSQKGKRQGKIFSLQEEGLLLKTSRKSKVEKRSQLEEPEELKVEEEEEFQQNRKVNWSLWKNQIDLHPRHHWGGQNQLQKEVLKVRKSQNQVVVSSSSESQSGGPLGLSGARVWPKQVRKQEVSRSKLRRLQHSTVN